MANTITPTVAKAYFLTNKEVKDSYNETNFHPMSNVDLLQIYVEDGQVENIVTINYAPSIRTKWASHWFPCFYRGMVEHTLEGEENPRTFAQYIAYMPSVIASLNQNSLTPMAVTATIQQQSGANLIGSYATVASLPTSYEDWADLQDLEENDAVAYVYEAGVNGFYMVEYDSETETYSWELQTSSVAFELYTKQYNVWGLVVKAGYGNPAPITELTDEQYRMIWLEFGKQTADILLAETFLENAFNYSGSADEKLKAINLYSDDGEVVAIISHDGRYLKYIDSNYPNMEHELGLNLYIEVKTDEAVSNGDILMFTGQVGASGRKRVAKATRAEINDNPSLFAGVATYDMANNENGLINWYGVVRGINTTAYSQGDAIYIDTSVGATAGAWTTSRPIAPNVQVKVGTVGVIAVSGEIEIRPEINSTLGDLHDVHYNDHTFTDEDILVYDLANSRWKVITKAEYLSDVVMLSDDNVFTGDNTFNNPITLPQGVEDTDSINKLQMDTKVEGDIETHDLSEASHLFIRQLIEDLEQDISRLDGRGKSFGEVPYTTAEMQGFDDATIATNIKNYVESQTWFEGTYTPSNGDLVYDEGVGDGVDYHEWEYNGTAWVDNGAINSPKASNTVFGQVKGNSYVSIVAGLMQILLADNATYLKDSGSSDKYTYQQIYDAIQARYTKTEIDGIITDYFEGYGVTQTDLTPTALTDTDTLALTELDGKNQVIFICRETATGEIDTDKVPVSELTNGTVIEFFANANITATVGATDITFSDVGTGYTLKIYGIELQPMTAEQIEYQNQTVDEALKGVDSEEITYRTDGKVSQVVGDNVTTTPTYDVNGNLTKITEVYSLDGKTYETTFVRDALGRIINTNKQEVI